MKVKVLGPGCAKCKKLYAEAEKAAAASGLPVELEKVEGIDEIVAYGVMMTPALVIDEKVVTSGRVLSSGDIAKMLAAAAAKGNA
jgi:small redox-active disulfide protein 2